MSACLAVLPAAAAAPEDAEAAKMEEAMNKYGNPGKEHMALRKMAGTWKAESKYWMAPDTPPMSSTGRSKIRMLMKGRYVSEQFSAESPEFGSFQGQGTLAYDRLAKEYIHTWIDTMGTGIMISRGQASEDGKTIVLNAPYKDPVTMQDLNYRIVFHTGEEESRRMEMFVTYPGKEEFRTMEVTYTKVAEPKRVEGKSEEGPAEEVQP
jgi:hypothetical protein